MLVRKVYNNDDMTFLSVYLCLQSPRVILCCSPHRFADLAATHYDTQDLQTLIHGKRIFNPLIKARSGHHLTSVSVTGNFKQTSYCLS